MFLLGAAAAVDSERSKRKRAKHRRECVCVCLCNYLLVALGAESIKLTVCMCGGNWNNNQ